MGNGLNTIIQIAQSIEAAYQQLIQILPSLAPVAAQGVTQLRAALTQGLSEMAQQGSPVAQPPMNGQADPSAQPTSPMTQ